MNGWTPAQAHMLRRHRWPYVRSQRLAHGHVARIALALDHTPKADVAKVGGEDFGFVVAKA